MLCYAVCVLHGKSYKKSAPNCRRNKRKELNYTEKQQQLTRFIEKGMLSIHIQHSCNFHDIFHNDQYSFLSFQQNEQSMSAEVRVKLVVVGEEKKKEKVVLPFKP